MNVKTRAANLLLDYTVDTQVIRSGYDRLLSFTYLLDPPQLSWL